MLVCGRPAVATDGQMRVQEKVYRPPKYLRYAAAGLLLVSLLVLVLQREISFTSIAFLLMSLVSAGALAEQFLARVLITDSGVEIVQLFNKKTIKISEIRQVKIQDHELWIYLKNGKVVGMPDWFSDRHSLYQVLKHKLRDL